MGKAEIGERVLTVGDPIPWFTLPSNSNPQYHFDTVGGYRTVLFFFGSSRHAASALALKEFCHRQSQFSQLDIPFFGISIDSEDTCLAEAIEYPKYCKFLWDFEQQVSQQFGVCQTTDQGVCYAPTAFVLDENLRIFGIFPVPEADPIEYVDQVLSFLKQLPALPPPQEATRQAPVLLIPHVFEPAFCRHLIQRFEADGGRDSGFMREKEGRTIEVLDHHFKRRRDFNLEEAEPELLQTVNERVIRRVKPEIEKAFQFSITRFERHVVACYESETGGFFNRHRDNTTKGTAHRRFAMTVNLNTDEYEGGCLWFPEYGAQRYRPTVGEAIIFSCSLLHEVTPMLKGRRFALLSFFYDDEAAQIRERNRQYLVSHSNVGAKQTSNSDSSADSVPAVSVSAVSVPAAPAADAPANQPVAAIEHSKSSSAVGFQPKARKPKFPKLASKTRPLRLLFLHPNFPAQFRHLTKALARDRNCEVVFGTTAAEGSLAGVHKAVYAPSRDVSGETHHYVQSLEAAVLQGQAVFRIAHQLKVEGFIPDVVYGHSGWGPTLFIPDIFPQAKLCCYFEWFYRAHGSDCDFNAAESLEKDDELRIRIRNTTILLDLVNCTQGLCPTHWQKQQFPPEFHDKLNVLHDGIDTDFFKPRSGAKLVLSSIGLDLSDVEEIVTYTTRGMEPHRGFPQLMQAVALIQQRRPQCHVVVAGEDQVFYGRELADGKTYKQLMLEQLPLDLSRLHFTGLLSYSQYLQVLQVSSAHIYLTYPFVLSWSMLEAMSTGCLVIGSSTPPVIEVIRDGENGLLVDFFSPEAIADRVDEVLDHPDRMAEIRAKARETILKHYDLNQLLPQHLQWLTRGSSDRM